MYQTIIQGQKQKPHMKSVLIFLLLVLAFVPARSQDWDDDITIQYMKANVLFNSGRFDEAVRMYNRILAQDEYHLMALLMRGKAKYELGAYKGTKNDALEFIEKGGINKDVIHLMARTEFRLENFQAANNYILTALELDIYDGELYYMAGEISLNVGNKNDACERFEKGALLGHARSAEKLSTICGGQVLSRTQSRWQGQVVEEVSDKDKQETNSDEILSAERIEADTVTSAPVFSDEPTMPEPDRMASQDIPIDSKLVLQVTNGLGDRKVETTPNIFMLSTEDGHVVIDVCVNADGKVVSSSFNRGQSSILRSSLTSLAIRKSREFVFMPSLRSEQCGSIIYFVKS